MRAGGSEDTAGTRRVAHEGSRVGERGRPPRRGAGRRKTPCRPSGAIPRKGGTQATSGCTDVAVARRPGQGVSRLQGGSCQCRHNQYTTGRGSGHLHVGIDFRSLEGREDLESHRAHCGGPWWKLAGALAGTPRCRRGTTGRVRGNARTQAAPAAGEFGPGGAQPRRPAGDRMARPATGRRHGTGCTSNIRAVSNADARSGADRIAPERPGRQCAVPRARFPHDPIRVGPRRKKGHERRSPHHG